MEEQGILCTNELTETDQSFSLCLKPSVVYLYHSYFISTKLC